MQDWIDTNQIAVFPKQVYLKALDMYKTDHETFFKEDCMTMPKEKFLQHLHKSKSGAKLLGFTQLCAAVVSCENDPENQELRAALSNNFDQTLLFVGELV